ARLGGRYERGILVPYSGLRMAIVLGAIACLALPMLGFVVFADAFADDPGESPWPVRLVGAVGTVFFGLGGIPAADVTLPIRTLDAVHLDTTSQPVTGTAVHRSRTVGQPPAMGSPLGMTTSCLVQGGAPDRVRNTAVAPAAADTAGDHQGADSPGRAQCRHPQRRSHLGGRRRRRRP
ncbi:MAG TPA: hypothetical protein VIQ02_19195, partial [Jiangellaceae bacterium]